MTVSMSSKPRRAAHGDRPVSDGLVGGGLSGDSLTRIVAIFVFYLAAAAVTAVGLPLTGTTSPAVARAAGVGTVVVACWWLVLRLRTRMRRQIRDRAIEGLARHLQLRTLDERACHTRRWEGGWVGVPGRVVWRYGPTAPCTDHEWRDYLIAETGRRFGATYRVASHKPRARRLVLVRGETPTPARPAQVARVETFSQQLFGVRSVVTPTLDGSGELTAFVVSSIESARYADRVAQARVERKVSNLLPGRWRARFDITNDRVNFQLRPAFPESIWLPPLRVDPDRDLLSTYDEVTIPYAVDEDGTEMVWRPAIQSNLLLVGSTGSGKTVAAHTLLVQASRHGWPIWVGDGKGTEFLGFQDWPNVQIVATIVPEIAAMVTKVRDIMEQRYRLVVSGQARRSDFEPLLVFLDEWTDFRANLLEWYRDVKPPGRGVPSKPRALDLAASIARKGRTSRIHLIFGTQRPDTEFLTGEMRENFRKKISMGRLSPQLAMMVWQSPVVGATVPELVRGRATTVNDDGVPVEAQTYRIPDPQEVVPGSDEQRLLDDLRPSSARHERLLIVPPEEDPQMAEKLEKDPARYVTYDEYVAAQWVLASERPDLDPVAHRSRPGGDGRQLSSPMAILGLGTPAADESAPALSTASASAAEPGRVAGPPELRVVPDLGEEPTDDGRDGYEAATQVASGDVAPGDLVLVDDALDQWAVVEHVDDDLLEDGCVAISWRDDEGEDGEISVDQDAMVTVRHPALEQTVEGTLHA